MNHKLILATLIVASPSFVLATLEEALQEAVRNGNKAKVQTLLNKGANPNKYDRNWECYRPLSIAVQNGNVEIVEMLLQAGAHPAYSITKITPEYEENIEKIEELLIAYTPKEQPSPIMQALLDRNKQLTDFTPEDIIAVLTFFEQLCVPCHSTDSSVYSQTHLVLLGVLVSALSKYPPVGKHITYLRDKWMHKNTDQDKVQSAIQSLKDSYPPQEIWKQLEGYFLLDAPACLAFLGTNFEKATLFMHEFKDAFDYGAINPL